MYNNIGVGMFFNIRHHQVGMYSTLGNPLTKGHIWHTSQVEKGEKKRE